MMEEDNSGGRDRRSQLIHTTNIPYLNTFTRTTFSTWYSAPVEKRDTTRNNENGRVERIATERGSFIGVIFFYKFFL
jgi:hypothetical protein